MQISNFEDSVLPKNVIPGTVEEYEQYINMSNDEIQRISSDELLIISLKLTQYALYIQRCRNKEKAYTVYYNHKLKDAASPYYKPGAGSWEYTEQHAINKNEAAKIFKEKLIEHTCRLNLLEDVTSQVKNISDTFRNIYYDRRRSDKIPD